MSQSAKRFDTQVSLFNYLKKYEAQPKPSTKAASRPALHVEELLQNRIAAGRCMPKPQRERERLTKQSRSCMH